MKKIMKTYFDIDECKKRLEMLFDTQNTTEVYTLNPLDLWKKRKLNPFYGSISGSSFVIHKRTFYKQGRIFCNGVLSLDPFGTIIESEFFTGNFNASLKLIVFTIIGIILTIINLISNSGENTTIKQNYTYHYVFVIAICISIFLTYKILNEIRLMGNLARKLNAAIVSEED